MDKQNISPKDFSKHLFWDVDVEILDLKKYKTYVIRRAMEYGLMKDWDLLKKLYSLNEIKKAIVTARSMDPKVIHFVSVITNTPLKSFRCYTNQQSSQSFYGY
jgi:hypothetical protein